MILPHRDKQFMSKHIYQNGDYWIVSLVYLGEKVQRKFSNKQEAEAFLTHHEQARLKMKTQHLSDAKHWRMTSEYTYPKASTGTTEAMELRTRIVNAIIDDAADHLNTLSPTLQRRMRTFIRSLIYVSGSNLTITVKGNKLNAAARSAEDILIKRSNILSGLPRVHHTYNLLSDGSLSPVDVKLSSDGFIDFVTALV